LIIPTILVVEDNPMNLELVRDVLTSASMKVVEARTAHEGLTAAAEIKPDLLQAGRRGTPRENRNGERGDRGRPLLVELFRAPARS
jgi:hypothetical protein